MNTLTILIGLPGAGKSTYCGTITDTENVVVLSTDDIREKMFGYTFNDTIKEGVFHALLEETVTNLKCQKNVILDTTYLNDGYSRHIFLNAIREIISDIHVKAVYFNTSLDECIRRNDTREGHRRVSENVIRDLHAELSIEDVCGLINEFVTYPVSDKSI